jgi:hypothetical protein
MRIHVASMHWGQSGDTVLLAARSKPELLAKIARTCALNWSDVPSDTCTECNGIGKFDGIGNREVACEYCKGSGSDLPNPDTLEPKEVIDIYFADEAGVDGAWYAMDTVDL